MSLVIVTRCAVLSAFGFGLAIVAIVMRCSPSASSHELGQHLVGQASAQREVVPACVDGQADSLCGEHLGSGLGRRWIKNYRVLDVDDECVAPEWHAQGSRSSVVP